MDTTATAPVSSAFQPTHPPNLPFHILSLRCKPFFLIGQNISEFDMLSSPKKSVETNANATAPVSSAFHPICMFFLENGKLYCSRMGQWPSVSLELWSSGQQKLSSAGRCSSVFKRPLAKVYFWRRKKFKRVFFKESFQKCSCQRCIFLRVFFFLGSKNFGPQDDEAHPFHHL